MNKLIMCKGLPASGKTTWTKQQVEEGKGQVKRISMDDLREMFDNGRHSKEREKIIKSTENMVARSLLLEGKTVIIDDTNLPPQREEYWRTLAEQCQAGFEIKNFTDISLNECLKRNEQRGLKVPQRVIKDMYNRHLRKAPQYKHSNYIICDLDGTLAHMEGRSPYDWHRVGEDKVDLPISVILEQFNQGNNYDIIIVSARDGSCIDKTEEWLTYNDILYDDLIMRSEGDNRPDSEVKVEILESLMTRYNNEKPLFVLDDRDQVVNMWRSKGIKCLQVEPGDF